MIDKNKRDAVIVAYGRSPLARANRGSLAQLHPIEYGAQTLKGVLSRLDDFDLALIEDVIVGCSYPEGELGFNMARMIAQYAGLPDSVPGQTLTRFCSSGLQSIETAVNAIKTGEMDIVVAGGVEKMTGLTMGHPEQFQYDKLIQKKPATYMAMGITAENVASRYNVTRYEMDRMAVESHKKAAKAQSEGKFDMEIVPIHVEIDGKKYIVNKDEGIRPDTNLEKLSELTPCFKQDGLVTAATSSQMTDGAAFVVLMARETAEKLGKRPIARFVTFAVAGVPAEIMGIGPIKAVPKAMKKAGLCVEDMDVIEINEAFAAQAIPCINELKLPKEKVNPNGGAIALGHPLGATGTVLTCKIISELTRIKGKYGLVTMCIGTGMGAAGIWEMENDDI